ncbi:MAG: CAP domain-containing protein, partial [Chloroflexota bacterium]
MKRLLILLVILGSVIFAIYGQERGADRADLIPELMGRINVWRLQQGLEPVVYNPLLEEIAIAQADFLMEQNEIGDIHAGRQGESARQRSQFPQFAWATYGHPELFAFTEIAAVGSIDSAMDFWMNSQIHTDSALNPTYREAGVAARQRNSGVLFIVVFGGQPNVLPAMTDPDVNELYLTNERIHQQPQSNRLANHYAHW